MFSHFSVFNDRGIVKPSVALTAIAGCLLVRSSDNTWKFALAACPSTAKKALLPEPAQSKARERSKKKLSAELLKAAWEGDVAHIKALLAKGAEINRSDNHRHEPYGAYTSTALMEAVSEGRLAAVKLLLERGADPNIQQNYGATALIIATQSQNTAVLKLLLSHGANTMLQDDLHRSAMTYAISSWSKTCVEILKRGEASLRDIPAQKGMRFAVQDCGGPEEGAKGYAFIKWMLDHGADVNSRGFQDFQDSKTILMLACSAPVGREADFVEAPDIVQLLLSRKAQVNLRDEDGRTALYYAQYCEDKRIRSMLKRAGGRL